MFTVDREYIEHFRVIERAKDAEFNDLIEGFACLFDELYLDVPLTYQEIQDHGFKRCKRNNKSENLVYYKKRMLIDETLCELILSAQRINENEVFVVRTEFVC
ncbi:MAG: hypothetical protein Q4B60_04095 [Erysipelotrichaceae bacterium]|nr:hypothetical protein [Erysipelotrichaceae bacterium]